MDVVRFMGRENLQSAIIVSDPYHMYRAQWTYGHLTDADAIDLTYIASGATGVKKNWWKDTTERRTVLREIPKIFYYWIAHGLLGVRNDPQWIVATELWYNRFLIMNF